MSIEHKYFTIEYKYFTIEKLILNGHVMFRIFVFFSLDLGTFFYEMGM